MINKPTSDFIATTFDVALAHGEDGAITAKIGTGLDIPATNSFLQVDYNSTEAVGDADSPETIFYGAYNSATGALTGVVRGQAGTTDVAHSAGAEVQCGMTTAFFEGDWKEIKGTFAYASATTITVASGAASIYSVGTKLRFQNNDSGTYLYAYVVTVADALLTVVGDAVPNATLTDAYFSNASSPVGFPHAFATAIGFVRFEGGTMIQYGSLAITCVSGSDNVAGTLNFPAGLNFADTKYTFTHSGANSTNFATVNEMPLSCHSTHTEAQAVITLFPRAGTWAANRNTTVKWRAEGKI